MPGGNVLIIAALGAAAFFGGKAAYQHGIKPAAKHTACFVVKVATLGHKRCAPKHKADLVPPPTCPPQGCPMSNAVAAEQ